MSVIPYCLLVILAASAAAQSSVLECLAWGQEGCMEEELAGALRTVENIPTLRLTRHLTLVHHPLPQEEEETERTGGEEDSTLERLERFLYSHSLQMEVPQELVSGARGLLPESFLSTLPPSLTVPLADPSEGRSKGFIRKVVLPFVLGLKFKATAVIPIAIALIALKTWKALTLGLLSIVLSAALVIFRLTRPKVLNYEVVYPPSASHHHIVDDHHYHHARELGSDLAFRAHHR